MQTFTTQSHQRNYQGNVVIPETPPTPPHKTRKFLRQITLGVFAATLITTSGILGMTALHKSSSHTPISTPVPLTTTVHEPTPMPRLPKRPAQPYENYPVTLPEVADEHPVATNLVSD